MPDKYNKQRSTEIRGQTKLWETGLQAFPVSGRCFHLFPSPTPLNHRACYHSLAPRLQHAALFLLESLWGFRNLEKLLQCLLIAASEEALPPLLGGGKRERKQWRVSHTIPLATQGFSIVPGYFQSFPECRDLLVAGHWVPMLSKPCGFQEMYLRRDSSCQGSSNMPSTYFCWYMWEQMILSGGNRKRFLVTQSPCNEDTGGICTASSSQKAIYK